MKKIAISSSIIMLCLSLIQTALFSHIPFFLITADLALVYIVFVAIHNGSRSAMLLGFATGLFLDFMSLSPLGLSSFILTFIAFFLGKLYGRYNLNHILFSFVLTLLATFTKAILILLLYFLFGSAIKVYSLYESTFWIELALNLIFAPLLFVILNRFPTFFKSL